MPPSDEVLLPFEEARERVLRLASPLPGEWIPLEQAVGRTIAGDVFATRTLPPWENSAMDGYAVRAADASELPSRLRVVETIFAGQMPKKAIAAGECSRIMTGAPLPVGADAVVMQEKTRSIPQSSEVEILDRPAPGTNVRPRGEDAREGELLLAKGTPLGLPEAASLWAQGVTHAAVPRKPIVALFSTGDELCRPDEPANGRIVDTNSLALALAVERAGGTPRRLGIARDTLEEVSAKLAGARGADLVLVSAGASVGERDFARQALQRIGVRIDFWRVAMRPGKPLAVGTLGNSIYFALPGNPTSSLVSFELFVRPTIRKMLGHPEASPARVAGRVAETLKKKTGLTHFVRVVGVWKDGALWAHPLSSQTSGVIRSASKATHLLVFPANCVELHPGEAAELLPLSWVA
jgi:molybdopterin molybdotransferase